MTIQQQWLEACSPAKFWGDQMGCIETVLHSDGRLLRLFTIACVREVWHLLDDERSRRGVEVAERYADGLASSDDMLFARLAAEGVAAISGSNAAKAAAHCTYDDKSLAVTNYNAGSYAAAAAASAAASATNDDCFTEASRNRQADLLAAMADQPFDPKWRTTTVIALAQQIYTFSQWERAPILSDALRDEGVTDPPSELFRGCWLLDAILRKRSRELLTS